MLQNFFSPIYGCIQKRSTFISWFRVWLYAFSFKFPTNLRRFFQIILIFCDWNQISIENLQNMAPHCQLFVVGVAHTTNYAGSCNGKHSSIHFLSHMKKNTTKGIYQNNFQKRLKLSSTYELCCAISKCIKNVFDSLFQPYEILNQNNQLSGLQHLKISNLFFMNMNHF